MPTVSAYQIPFAKDGSIMPFSKPDWDRPSNVPQAAEWRNREPFPATLVYVETKRHRATHMSYWRDQEGRTFPMFAMDMGNMIEAGAVIKNRTVTGQWIGVKRAENYGIQYVGP